MCECSWAYACITQKVIFHAIRTCDGGMHCTLWTWTMGHVSCVSLSCIGCFALLFLEILNFCTLFIAWTIAYQPRSAWQADEKRAKTTVLSRANAYIKSILLRLEYKIDLTKLLFMHSCLVRSIFFMAHKKVRLKWYQPPTLCTQFAMHAYFKNELFDDCTSKTVFLFVLLTNVTNWWVFKRLYQCPISKQFIAS